MNMMKKIASIVLVAVVIGACDPSNPFAPPPAEDYLNELVDVMKNNHINKATINWDDLRTQVLQKGAGAATISAANDAVLLALELLDDRSSFVLTATGAIIEYKVPCEDEAAPEPTVPADIGYVLIPPYSNFGINAAIFAEKMHGTISSQDNASLKGWIIDLRGNTGGNLWPMIAGIGPVLGNGTVGYFVDSDGLKKTFAYKDGTSFYNDEAVVTVSFPYVDFKSAGKKIAVLVDHSTSNAGEGVMVAFSGMANSRSFGSATCGQGGGNQPFQLSDRSVLYLNVAYLEDRNEQNLQGVITPDEVIDDQAAVFNAAVDWINN